MLRFLEGEIMANYNIYTIAVSLAGDGVTATYSFNPSNGSGVLGLPTNTPGVVLNPSVVSGPTSPNVTASILLGIITLTFSTALQAVNSALSNLYTVQMSLGY
jgi:hypothetical protein